MTPSALRNAGINKMYQSTLRGRQGRPGFGASYRGASAKRPSRDCDVVGLALRAHSRHLGGGAFCILENRIISTARAGINFSLGRRGNFHPWNSQGDDLRRDQHRGRFGPTPAPPRLHFTWWTKEESYRGRSGLSPSAAKIRSACCAVQCISSGRQHPALNGKGENGLDQSINMVLHEFPCSSQ